MSIQSVLVRSSVSLVVLALAMAGCAAPTDGEGTAPSDEASSVAKEDGAEFVVDEKAKAPVVGDVADFISGQRLDALACPLGSYATGIHIGNNQLLCQWGGGLQTWTEHNDFSTQQQGMHACPWGQVMTGVRVNENRFLCTSRTGGANGRYVDTSTQRQGMHACPIGMRMVGLHAGKNQLLCEY